MIKFIKLTIVGYFNNNDTIFINVNNINSIQKFANNAKIDMVGDKNNFIIVKETPLQIIELIQNICSTENLVI